MQIARQENLDGRRDDEMVAARCAAKGGNFSSGAASTRRLQYKEESLAAMQIAECFDGVKGTKKF